MSKWKVTTELLPDYPWIEVTAQRIEPEPHVVRKLTMQFHQPPTPAELRDSITTWLEGVEEILPNNADFAHAAEHATGTYTIGEAAE